MSDSEALYESAEVHSHGEQTSTYEEADGFEDCADWLLNGCWPLKEEEHVIALTDAGFLIANVDKCLNDQAELHFLKPLKVRGQPALSHWIVDATAETLLLPKESVLKVRPILEPERHSGFILLILMPSSIS